MFSDIAYYTRSHLRSAIRAALMSASRRFLPLAFIYF
jgi:hypothetical protein